MQLQRGPEILLAIAGVWENLHLLGCGQVGGGWLRTAQGPDVRGWVMGVGVEEGCCPEC